MLIIVIILILALIYMIYNTNKTEYFCKQKLYDSNQVYQHLSFISTVLTNNDIKHWITFNTLLGAIKYQDILNNDNNNEFDLGALIGDADKIMALNGSIDNFGYKFQMVFVNLPNKKNVRRNQIKVFYKNVPCGNIYLYYKCKDGFMRRYDPVNKILFWPNDIFPSFIIDDLYMAKIKNGYFPMPKNSEILLKYYNNKNSKLITNMVEKVDYVYPIA